MPTVSLSGDLAGRSVAKSSFFNVERAPARTALRFGDRLKSLRGVLAPLSSSSSELSEEDFATCVTFLGERGAGLGSTEACG